jgi:hypothetical protein
MSSTSRYFASDPLSDPPIPDQPRVPPDTPSPGTPADLPDIGAPEPEPDQPRPLTGIAIRAQQVHRDYTRGMLLASAGYQRNAAETISIDAAL